MFWNTLGLDYITESMELDKKIADPNITLQEILEDSNCFQEIRNRSAGVMALWVYVLLNICILQSIIITSSFYFNDFFLN